MKAHWTQWAMLFVLVTVVAFLFLGDRACGQEVLAPPNDQARAPEAPEIPDAPRASFNYEPQAPHILPYYTYENVGESAQSGTVASLQQCQTVKMDENGRLAYIVVDCAKFPTQWRALEKPAPRPATFLTFRKHYTDPPLRTSRGVLTKKFVLLHLGAGVAMVMACRNPRSGEDWGSEAPVPFALAGLDYLMSRFFSEALAVEAPAYAMQHYARAAAK